MRYLFIIFLMLFGHFICTAQGNSRVLFFTMDGDIHRKASSVWEKWHYRNVITVNDTPVDPIKAWSIHLYETPHPAGKYCLKLNLGSGNKRITIDPPEHSLTIIRFSVHSGRPLYSIAEVVSLADFEICYNNNTWLQDELSDAGYHSIKELTNGYNVSGKEVERTGYWDPRAKIRLDDTMYYEDYSNVGTRDSAKFYRIVHIEREGYYSTHEYFISNAVKGEGHFSSIDPVRREGTFTYYSKEGNIEEKGNYHNDQREGKWEYFYDTSGANIWYTCNYMNGYRQGLLTSYYPDGKIKRKELHDLGTIPTDSAERQQFLRRQDTTAKGTCYDKLGNEIPFTPFEIMPHPSFSLAKYLSESLKYPDAARENDIEGRVIVKFKIDTNGTVSGARVIRHVSPEIDAEAERAVGEMPLWYPGIRDDKVVQVYFNLPIVFKLD